ncbi:hypothetical protein IMG5_001330 [Ichthyophthirius multifiliis]|uniref:Uncharacterized protein n=1 Tax=Ichthyophthirius multifiliis TaxID=5932 RepID=G0QIS5_ICHMU|nr:hypothetical protein IMG5_001330 [Ichthyophthirius multifiliis]EGR34904.1 hypothetical protein IMG5_001330 [Ichthyophthirius multifiliis]|eukprot:XP_004040208.1 hypothetical protein IMG5_001330 [Ichthyophthirius multifiliis]
MHIRLKDIDITNQTIPNKLCTLQNTRTEYKYYCGSDNEYYAVIQGRSCSEFFAPRKTPQKPLISPSLLKDQTYACLCSEVTVKCTKKDNCYDYCPQDLKFEKYIINNTPQDYLYPKEDGYFEITQTYCNCGGRISQVTGDSPQLGYIEYIYNYCLCDGKIISVDPILGELPKCCTSGIQKETQYYCNCGGNQQKVEKGTSCLQNCPKDQPAAQVFVKPIQNVYCISFCPTSQPAKHPYVAPEYDLYGNDYTCTCGDVMRSVSQNTNCYDLCSKSLVFTPQILDEENPTVENTNIGYHVQIKNYCILNSGEKQDVTEYMILAPECEGKVFSETT